jgi:hypothetical protein
MSERNTKSYKKIPKSYSTEQAKKDRELGEQGEIAIKQVINKWFDCEFQEDTEGWREMDFLCIEKRYACELKTRRMNIWKYPSILISTNKITECIRLNGLGFRTFLIFKLTDDIYFYEFVGKTIPNDFVKSYAVRTDRGYTEKHRAYYIPTHLLKKFSDYDTIGDYDYIEK